jgi:hypothetical protein
MGQLCTPIGTASPNNDPDADVVINVLAHELAEAATDPTAEGYWQDVAPGQENADKCRYMFDPWHRWNSGPANVVLGGKTFLLQRLWTNTAQGHCALASPSWPGWAYNWDGSGTLVYLGSDGVGNVATDPLHPAWDISASTYGSSHPGWYPQMLAAAAGAHPVGDLPGWVEDWSVNGNQAFANPITLELDTLVYLDSPGRSNVSTQPVNPQWDIDGGHYAEGRVGWWAQLLATFAGSANLPGSPRLRGGNWVVNWTDDGTWVHLANSSSGTGGVDVGNGRRADDWDVQSYASSHPGWWPQLLAVLAGVAIPAGLPPGWVRNWDGSATWVYVGSDGFGNVATDTLHYPQWDVSASDYGAAHPGWYCQLLNVQNGVQFWDCPPQ